VVKVKVLEVDLKRKRIALTMRLDEQAAKPAAPEPRAAAAPQQPQKPREQRNERGGERGGERAGRGEPQRDRRPAASGAPGGNAGGGNAGGGKRPDRGDRQDRGEKRAPREPAVMSAGPALGGALAEAFARAQAAKQQK
jgi:uncharacterized protein